MFEELLAKYEAAVVTADELEKILIKPRAPLVGKWMKEGDLGFVWGERGSGKTWFVDAIATHLSTGHDLSDWTIPKAADVLYVDGEMPSEDTRNRLTGLSPDNKRLHILNHELLFDRTGLTMNLTDPRNQRVLTELCIRKTIKLLVLDNLSCLFSGLPENEADAWELVLNWLLDFRRRRIAVLIVHHSSKSGSMRSTYRREDAAFWVIRVDPVKDRGPNDNGARFQTTFEKQRNSAEQEWTRNWIFETSANRDVSIQCEEITFDLKVLYLIEAGLQSATEIAKELHVNKSTICRAATRLEKLKFIEIHNRQYRSIRYRKP